ncbi:MAG TPA: tetratricopeptide repeat protein [Candidatus Eisenbacteria bacterium]
MNVRGIAAAAAAAWLVSLLGAGAVEARNFHCAGGIRYVVGGLSDKDKGNTVDYVRQMQKAVEQLVQCATEDSLDYEAIGYLGWAYAEIESCGPAGLWFAKAIDGLNAKGDKKKADLAANNRDSYWASKLNDGISKISSAQTAYPDFLKKPENEADVTLKGEAEKYYQQAVHSLTCASFLRPNHPPTIRNLGSVYAFMGDFTRAERVFREGLKVAPEDSALKMALRSVRMNYANQLSTEKRYDEAIDYFGDLLKVEPGNADLHSSLGTSLLNRAQTLQGDARKPDFKHAGEEYQKAGEIRQDDSDLYFNAAVAYQNGGENAQAEAMWRAALKLRPEDPEIRSGLAGSLAELGKYAEAVSILQAAVAADPKNKKLHRQLGGVYTKANNNPKGTEELMIYLALDRGQPVPDVDNYVTYQPRKGTDVDKTLVSVGRPEAVYLWQEDDKSATFRIETRDVTASGATVKVTQLPSDKTYETWFYWTKKQAYHFKAGVLSVKSDWGSAGGATGSRN